MDKDIDKGIRVLENIYEKYRDLSLTVTYGLFSALLGLIKLSTPGFEGSYSDLREVALIVCLFHLRKPIFIIPLCLFTLIGIPVDTKIIAIFIMHAIPLTIIWHVFHWLQKKKLPSLHLAIYWNVVVFFYFAALLYPILIVSYQLLGINTDVDFISSYVYIFKSGVIEMVTTCFISALYLLQLSMRRKLQYTNIHLEEIVSQRTKALMEANNNLLHLNENLEHICQDRTKRINDQLTQITKYAHMNSHEVRAPLARIMGLVNIVKKEKNPEEIFYLLEKIEENSFQLDQIVREMNLLLGPEDEEK